MTVDPEVPLGTLNVQLNAPVASVVSEPVVQLEVGITTPSKVNPTRLVTEKPVPDAVTVALMGPWPGVTVIAGVVTVNVVLGRRPEATSVAWIDCDPALDVGTKNVQTKPPVVSVVIVPPL